VIKVSGISQNIKQESALRQSLEKAFPPDLVEELLRCYEKLQQDYFLADYRPLCIEAARFAEIAIRMLQHAATGNHILLQSQIQNFTAEVVKLGQLPSSVANDSIRLLMPRVLQVVYDVRNKRNVGHTGGEVDENFADATLALNCCNWVLAELTRIYHTGNIEQAQKIVDSIVEIKLPVIQDFDGFLKVLDPDLPLPSKVLVLLHHKGKNGADFEGLAKWIGKDQRKSLQNRLGEMVRTGYVHTRVESDNNQKQRCYITLAGEKRLAENIKKSTVST